MARVLPEDLEGLVDKGVQEPQGVRRTSFLSSSGINSMEIMEMVETLMVGLHLILRVTLDLLSIEGHQGLGVQFLHCLLEEAKGGLMFTGPTRDVSC